jgi:uncharacterized protein with NRDE domain
MCLIIFAYRVVPDAPLIVAANRDENFTRPAAPAAIWDDCPEILAGRDLTGGGTWLGVSARGRFAALTNFRNPATHRADAPSRGALVKTFLMGQMSAQSYVEELERDAVPYNGFCLLVGDGRQLFFYSNRAGAPAEVKPGVHGLANHLLNTPVPKVVKGRSGMENLIRAPFRFDEYLALLDDPTPACDDDLAKTGPDFERERRHSAMRILNPDYGTRCSTVLRITSSGTIDFLERTFHPDGTEAGDVRYRIDVTPPA